MLRTLPTLDPETAWAPFVPGEAEPWDRARVAHLHRRAGFAAPWAILERDRQEGPEAAVERLLTGEPLGPDGQPAAEFETYHDRLDREVAAGGSLSLLQAAWIYRMIFSPHPLRERMTLFWHNHFATSNAKVNSLRLMQRQNALLRREALGDFRTLLPAIARDPAMLLWLDAAGNRKARPNENYGREVMELFTLGRGHYTEKDVQEAARAFSGTFIRGDRYRFEPAQHDTGPKTILGQTGPFGADDVARILLDQPACAAFLARKLYRQFVSAIDEPSGELLAPLAQAIRDAKYHLIDPLRLILRSRLFHSPAMRRSLVKSPVELAVGTVRALELVRPTVSCEALAEACDRMGQALYAPPNVAGWEGGPAWINTTTSLARTNLGLALVGTSDEALGRRLDPKALAARHGATTPEAAAQFFLDLLLPDGVGPTVRDQIMTTARTASPAEAARSAVNLVLTAPEYQLA